MTRSARVAAFVVGGAVSLATMRGARADAPSGPDETKSAPTKPNIAYVVAAMGDSLTDPRSHGGLYLDDLKKLCPESRFDSYGKGGEMVNQMRRRFARDVFGAGDGKPKYTDVIVFGGVNDVYSDLTAGRTPAKIESDLGEMYAAARARGVRVVAIGIAPWGGFTRYYNASRHAATVQVNQWIFGERDAGKVDVAVDPTPLLTCGDPERLCAGVEPPFHDGIHFGPEGHRRLADALKRQAFKDCR
ncbi:MAG TPA: SGNH/GDSL hydrolase family protein [Polyangiaceae bacterium]|jgi:hypothetical protein|nr:SGNH/GDSL hydrolase family protein [Polyangiaceae bacterium]